MRELLRTTPAPSAGKLKATGPAMWPELERADADRGVLALRAALAGYGLESGRSVAIVAPPTPEALVALSAAGLCGARTMLVDPAVPDPLLAKLLREASVAFVLAGGEKTLRRIIDLRPDLDALELVLALVAPDPGGRPLPALSVAALVEEEGALETEPPADPGFEVVGPDGAVVRWAAADLARRSGELAGSLAISPADTVLVRLAPTARGWAPAVGAALGRQARLVLDSPGHGRLEEALGSHRPTIVVAESREIDACRAGWESVVAGGSWFFRKRHAWAIEKGANPTTRPWVRRLADRAVLASYRQKTGGRIRTLLAAGSTVDPATTRFFAAVGIPLQGVRG